MWPAVIEAAGRGRGLCWFETGEQHQVVCHHRGPDVGLEVIEPAPGTACQTVGSLEAGDPGLDDNIQDQAALAGDQVELVSVLHVAATLEDDVGMRLEQAYQLFAGRHRLAVKDAPLAL